MIRGKAIKGLSVKSLNTIELTKSEVEGRAKWKEEFRKPLQTFHKVLDIEIFDWFESMNHDLHSSRDFREKALEAGYKLTSLYPCYYQGWECDEWGATAIKDDKMYRLGTDHGSLTEEEFLPKVYLAGPDVFLPNAKEIYERKRAICREYGLVALTPIDSDVNDKDLQEASPKLARRIYKFDVKLMDEADACLANMDPFRGPGMDGGTAFEMGYMTAQGKPVVGYSSDTRNYVEKFEEFEKDYRYSGWQGEDYKLVENFGLTDNLMMVQAAGEEIYDSFEKAVRALAKLLKVPKPPTQN